MKKRIAVILAAVALCLCGCAETQEPTAEVIPARDNSQFKIEDVKVADLPTEKKDMYSWTFEDRYVLIGESPENDIAMYGLLKTEEGGAVLGDIGVIFRDGEQLQFFKWKYFDTRSQICIFTCEDLDGDGDIEVALSLHTEGVHTIYVLEKGDDGVWTTHQLTKTRINELIAADTSWRMSEDRKSVTWTVAGKDTTYTAAGYYEEWGLSYDPEKTAFKGAESNVLGTYVTIQHGETAAYQICYLIGYDANNGTTDMQAALDTLYADVVYHADGTFTFENYMLSAEAEAQ